MLGYKPRHGWQDDVVAEPASAAIALVDRIAHCGAIATVTEEASAKIGAHDRNATLAIARHNRTCFRVGTRLPDQWSPALLGAESSHRSTTASVLSTASERASAMATFRSREMNLQTWPADLGRGAAEPTLHRQPSVPARRCRPCSRREARSAADPGRLLSSWGLRVARERFGDEAVVRMEGDRCGGGRSSSPNLECAAAGSGSLSDIRGLASCDRVGDVPIARCQGPAPGRCQGPAPGGARRRSWCASRASRVASRSSCARVPETAPRRGAAPFARPTSASGDLSHRQRGSGGG
jgi:hypothetical protein